MEFPFVGELLEYWRDYPPEHELLRGLAGYEGKKTDRSNWRKQRAQEMQDEAYIPEETRSEETQSEPGEKRPSEFVPGMKPGGAKHLDCAPSHIQQAVERFKRRGHLEIPKPE